MTILTERAVNLFRDNLDLFSALGDSQRQQILLLLSDGKKRSVAELTAETNLSRPAISHHLKVLKNAQLLREHREGVRRYYQPMFSERLPKMNALIQTLQQLDCQLNERNT